MAKRILAIACMAVVIASNFVWLFPSVSRVEAAGEEFVVRVQYYGESGDKLREKARFSRAELEAMGASTYCYSNITRVGTVMVMRARGPEVMSIISNAGIDASSIKNITFVTDDGYTRNFNVGNHMTASRYYYPNLSSCYEKNEDGNALTPTEGALEGKTSVPSILALEFGESKMPGDHAEDLSMSSNKSYRFCMGQTDLTEGKMTNPRDDGGDITSMESCHSISGMDITLAGAPPEDEKETDMDDEVGNKDKDGNKDAEKKDKPTMQNVADKVAEKVSDKASDKASDKTADEKSKNAETRKIRVRELELGDRIVEKEETPADAEISALSEVEMYSRGTAIGTAAGAGALCSAGAISRIIRYRKNFK